MQEGRQSNAKNPTARTATGNDVLLADVGFEVFHDSVHESSSFLSTPRAADRGEQEQP